MNANARTALSPDACSGIEKNIDICIYVCIDVLRDVSTIRVLGNVYLDERINGNAGSDNSSQSRFPEKREVALEFSRQPRERLFSSLEMQRAQR